VTDKLIEKIEAELAAKGTCVDGEYTRAMEARIIADAKIIKAAEALAAYLNEMIEDSDCFSHYARLRLAAYRAAVEEGRG
jgi:hypothetical protein